MDNTTLLHICCAPCSVYCIDKLREEGIEPKGFFYNPNIHPFTEYRQRRDALKEYAGKNGIDLTVEDVYGLRDFILGIESMEFGVRCKYCYDIRMERTAQFAAENGFKSFTTTLLVSPYQNHEMIIKSCEEAGKKYGVQFLYRNFRPGFREGQQKAREAGIYMQKYCGCIFSEAERYRR